MRNTSCIVLVAACVALGCTPTRMHHELESPSYWWSATQGVCGHTIAVDLDGDVWTEKSCETGPQYLTRRKSLSEAEHESLRRAFAALPKRGTPPPDARCTETEHTLRQREPGREKDVVWMLCVEGAGEWDAKRVPSPYRRAVELMEAARHD